MSAPLASMILALLVGSEPGDQIVRCANLPTAEVANAVRLLRAKGCLETIGDRLRIRTLWYRAVVRSLRRNHLLPDTA